MEETDLIDIWRYLHPDERTYTWSRVNPTTVMCRLNFFLMSQGLVSKVNNTDILPGFRSDHSLVTMNFSNNVHKKGPGFWKLNCHLLKDEKYIDTVKTCIEETIKDNPETEPSLLWDTVKCRIRGTTIAYSSSKKKEEKNDLKFLEQELAKLKLKYEERLDDDLICQISQIENQVNELVSKKLKVQL